MPIIEIDGVGRVEVDSAFAQKTPDEQRKIVEEIASQLRGSKPSLPSEQPKTGLLDAAATSVDSAKSLLGRGVHGLAEMAGQDSLARWGSDLAKAGDQGVVQSRYQRPEDVAPSVAEGWRRDGLKGAAKAAVYGAAENAAPAAVGVGTGLAAAAGGAVPALLAGAGALGSGVMAAGSIAKEKEEKGLDPKLNGMDLATAVASGALDLIPVKGGGYFLRAAKNIGQDSVVNAGQDALQMADIAAQGGRYVPQEVGDRLLENAAVGGVTSAGIHGAKAVVDAPGAALRAGKGAMDRAQVRSEFQENPDQVASDLRVQKLYQDRLATVDNYGAKNDQQPASVIFKSVMDNLEGNLKDAAQALKNAGQIDKDGHRAILEAISVAKRHNREPGVGGPDQGYFQTEIDKLDALGLDDQTTQTLKDGIRDLNTATANSKKMNMRGPAEAWGKWLGGAALSSLGGVAVPGWGLMAGVVGPAVGRSVGRRIDQFLGTQTPDVLRRAEARQKFADSIGLDPGNTVDSIGSVLQSAQARAAQKKAELDRMEAEFRASRADLRSKNIVPPGGFDRAIYDNLGLLPKEVDKGLAELVKRGQLPVETVAAFHDDPRSLMEGKQGLTLQNKLLALVNEGVLSRDQNWGPGSLSGMPLATPQSAAGGLQGVPGIRNPLAYKATLEAAQRAHSAALANAPDDAHRAMATEIANARSQEEKNQLLAAFLAQLPEVKRVQANALLSPLTGFGPKSGPTSPVPELVARRLSAVEGAPTGAQVGPAPVPPQAANQSAPPAQTPAPNPRGISIRGDTLIVNSPDFIEKVKRDKNVRAGLKASGFNKVQTRDGKHSVAIK